MVKPDEQNIEEDAQRVENENLRIDGLVDATLRGEMGRGAERKKNLGDDYTEVIRRVKAIRNQNGSEEGGLDPNVEEVPDSEIKASEGTPPENQGTEGLK